MAVFERDGARIHYEVVGEGHPILLFAPGGMRSVAQMWRERPDAPGEPLPWIDPRSALSPPFQVIAMDQRNAGASRAPVRAGDGWHSYAADHVALLDHLGIERTHLMGGCIGSSYCLGLCQAAPERVVAAVLQNPIGLSADNRPAFEEMFAGWSGELLAARPELSAAALQSLGAAMFGGDFVFSVDRDFVQNCAVPLLVLAGGDTFHPRAVAEEIASLAPDARLVLEWAGPDRHDATCDLVREFLLAHTPARSA